MCIYSFVKFGMYVTNKVNSFSVVISVQSLCGLFCIYIHKYDYIYFAKSLAALLALGRSMRCSSTKAQGLCTSIST